MYSRLVLFDISICKANLRQQRKNHDQTSYLSMKSVFDTKTPPQSLQHLKDINSLLFVPNQNKNQKQQIYQEEDDALTKEDGQIKEEQFNIDAIIEDEAPLGRIKEEPAQMSQKELNSQLRQIQRIIDQKRQENQNINNNMSIAIPSNQELQRCLKQIETVFPHLDIKMTLSLLHNCLHQNCIDSKQNGVRMSNDGGKICIDQCFTPAVLRNNEEKKIAISFLNHGYGLKVLREVVEDQSLTPTKYNNIITTIMKNTFRAIESAMKKIKIDIPIVGSHEERILRAPLVNSDKWLPPDDLVTFRMFIKGTCGLGQVNITSNATKRLYNCIMKQLKQREDHQKSLNSMRKPQRSSKSNSSARQFQQYGSSYPNMIGQGRMREQDMINISEPNGVKAQAKKIVNQMSGKPRLMKRS